MNPTKWGQCEESRDARRRTTLAQVRSISISEMIEQINVKNPLESTFDLAARN